MTKNQLLEKLGTNETEWDSYWEKSCKFVNDGLNDGERALHKRIYSKTLFAPILSEAVTPRDISDLYEVQKGLLEGVFDTRNICGKYILRDETTDNSDAHD